VDADGVPLLQLPDLVAELDPRAAADEDVHLLLVLVLVGERDAVARLDALITEPGVLHPERHTGHASLDVGRQAEVRGLVVDVFLQVDVGVVGHGGDFAALLHSEPVEELLL
jgi:hypothetical protein